MEQCAVCHEDFEPIELPIEMPQEIFGIKIPTVCPACIISGTAELFSVVADIIRRQQEQKK